MSLPSIDLSGPLLWFANRGTGIVLLVLYTAVVLLGILSATGRGPGRFVPRFVTQGLHRNLALLATVLLAAHVTTAVVDGWMRLARSGTGTLGIGTDVGSPWGRWTVLSCVAAVVVAVAGRAVARRVQVVRS